MIRSTTGCSPTMPMQSKLYMNYGIIAVVMHIIFSIMGIFLNSAQKLIGKILSIIVRGLTTLS